MELYLHVLKITDDEEKILITLSFMTDSPASDWCWAFTDSTLYRSMGSFGTWTDLKLILTIISNTKLQRRKLEKNLNIIDKELKLSMSTFPISNDILTMLNSLTLMRKSVFSKIASTETFLKTFIFKTLFLPHITDGKIN